MKKTVLVVCLVIVASLTLFAVNENVVTSQLQEKLSQTPETEFIRINISLKEKYDFMELLSATQNLSHEEKREFVTTELKQFCQESQQQILSELESFEDQGIVRDINPLWITNLINCYAAPFAVRQLSQRSDIRSIDWDETRMVLIDAEKTDEKKYEGNPRERDITWNVTLVNADDVWALGYTGEGVTVAVIDTGVRYTHNDLEDHVWDGSAYGYPNHGYDFYNNDNDPADDHGHGTHCAGTVAGDGTAGTQTGMAPDATIMCLKVLNSGGSGNESDVWDAIEFAVDYGANVISMSLGWQHSWGVDRESWRDTYNYALAAGVIASVAAGNEGDEQYSYPIPDNVRTPGDCPPPWLHPDQTLTGGVCAVVCVGATDSNDNIAYFSSLGPLDWSSINDYWDYPYDPEMGLIRPDICAPGMDIESLSYSSDTGYVGGWNGTSMATPCVAGVMALMIEKNSLITPAQIDQYLEENVAIPQSPKNNTYGSGRVDALASVNATPHSGFPTCVITDPLHGDYIVHGTTETITVAASDYDGSVTQVEFYIDGIYQTSDYSEPYEYDWDTTPYSLDDHTIKAIAVDNDTNETEHEITVTVYDPPDISIDPTSFSVNLEPDQTTNENLRISNDGVSELTYELDHEDRGQGGPDTYGYSWLDSNEPDGPVYDWRDISGSGTQVSFTHNDYATDLIPIGFTFSYYGIDYTQFRISPNGWIGFGDDWTDYHNYELPRVDAPRPAVFGFWDDLHPWDGSNGSGDVYYYGNTDSLVVWFDEVIHYSGIWDGTYDFEMILYANGRILFQYRTVSGDLDTCTLGIQNADGDDGLQVCYDENYVENNLAILFKKDWLSLSPTSGTVPGSSYDDVTLTFDSSGLTEGTYLKNLMITSNDPDEPEIIVPVTLTVGTVFPPDAPENVTIEIVGSNVQLSWDAVSGATSYTVYSDTDPYGTFSTVEWTGSATSWSEPLSGDIKFYRVTASN